MCIVCVLGSILVVTVPLAPMLIVELPSLPSAHADWPFLRIHLRLAGLRGALVSSVSVGSGGDSFKFGPSLATTSANTG